MHVTPTVGDTGIPILLEPHLMRLLSHPDQDHVTFHLTTGDKYTFIPRLALPVVRGNEDCRVTSQYPKLNVLERCWKEELLFLTFS